MSIFTSLRNFARDAGSSASVFIICLLPMFLALGGLAIDGSNALRVHTILQATADAAAHAAAFELPNKTTAAETASSYVEKNLSSTNNGILLAGNDFQAGNWDTNARVFTPDAAPLNGVRVVLRRSEGNGNALPTTFLRLIGRNSWDVSVSAVAATTGGNCVLALSTDGAEGIHSNGAPFAQLGCNIMSNSSATCHGHDLGAPIGSAHEANNGCGIIKRSNVPKISDPYEALEDNIPPDPCGGIYPQLPAHHGLPLPLTNQWAGTKNLSGNVIVCGDLQLASDVTIIAPSNAVLVVENGDLNTNGYKLQTNSGSALTIVFSGSNTGGYSHIPTGTGTLEFNAPTSGPWSGVAIYQDPDLTSGVDFTYAGNSPTWNISGLVYMPHASMTFSGAINKSHNGHSCFAMVINDITINGTGSIYDQGDCRAAGLSLPGADRAQLVE